MNSLDLLPLTIKRTPEEEGQLTPEDLVMETMREAVVYVRHVTNGTISDDQLISSCYEILSRCAPRFNPKFGRFFAFCKVAVRGDVRRSFKDLEVVRGGKTEVLNPLPSENPHTAAAEAVKPWDDSDVITPEAEIAEPDFRGINIRERWDLVKDVIERRCNPRERQILTLVYKGGFNFQEVANLIGVTRSAIQNANAKALRKIRVELLAKHRLFE